MLPVRCIITHSKFQSINTRQEAFGFYGARSLVGTCPGKMSENGVSALCSEILQKSNIVIISGAGISVAAGFPTFVDSKTGRYKASTKNSFDANVSSINTLTKVTSQFMEMNEKAKGRFPPKN